MTNPQMYRSPVMTNNVGRQHCGIWGNVLSFRIFSNNGSGSKITEVEEGTVP